MIALLLAVQVAVPAPAFVVIRDGAQSTSVPVTTIAGEASVRADALMKAMRGILITGTNLHYTLSLPRVRLDLIDGIPFAKADSVTIPLNRAPQVRGGQLYLPFQFVSEVIPRYGGGYFYDVAQGELRTFGKPITQPPTSVVAAAPPSATAARPPARRPPPTRKLVVIDAGHGGPDNGMSGPIGTSPWFVEKDVVLSVAKKVATVLKARGYDVLMTPARWQSSGAKSRSVSTRAINH